MKKPHNFVRVWIHTGEIRSLVQIALVTRPRQVRKVIRATMLPRHNMLDVKGVIGFVSLAQPTIPAPVIRTLPRQFADF